MALVITLFVLLFGSIYLAKLPYQLTPKVAKSIISIYTFYPNASPYEVEREVIDSEERQLKNINGLKEMVSTSKSGLGIVNLEFDEGIDLKDAFTKVLAKLNEVSDYPKEVKLPSIRLSGELVAPSMYLFLRSSDEKPLDYTYFVDDVLPIIERIAGVGEVFYSDGQMREVQILLNFKQLAYYNLSILEVISAIKKANLTSTAGRLDYDSREYRIRVVGEFASLQDIKDTIIKNEHGQIVKLRDVGSVIMGLTPLRSYNYHNNAKAVMIQIRPSSDANILDLNARVEGVVARLNETLLKEHSLVITTGRDERGYILSALKNLKFDIIFGVVISCIVLYIFLRNVFSIALIATIIPISIFGTFIILFFLHRSINLISLAGISFGISMIIDNAIVMIDNLYRHYLDIDDERPLVRRLLYGVNEVKGALFASCITTIAIFLPILELNDTAGQLFLDIAIAASASIGISLLVALFILPAFFYYLVQIDKSKFEPIKAFFANIGTKIQNSKPIKTTLKYLSKALKHGRHIKVAKWTVSTLFNVSPRAMSAKTLVLSLKSAVHALASSDWFIRLRKSIVRFLQKFLDELYHHLKNPKIMRVINKIKATTSKLDNKLNTAATQDLVKMEQSKSKKEQEEDKQKIKQLKQKAQDKLDANSTYALKNKVIAKTHSQVRFLALLNKALYHRKSCIIGILLLAMFLCLVSRSEVSYLPRGNKNLLYAYLAPPPASSYEVRKEIGQGIYEYLKDYLSENGFKGNDKYPAIEDLFFYSSPNYMSFGVTAVDKKRIRELKPLIKAAIKSAPNVSSVVVQSSIFGGNEGNSVELNLLGSNLYDLKAKALEAKAALEVDSGMKLRVRLVPDVEDEYKEINFYPNLDALAISSMSSEEFQVLLQVLLSEKDIGDYSYKGQTLDLMLKSDIKSDFQPRMLKYVQVYTPSNQIVPLYSLADIKEEVGLKQIRHFERERDVVLLITAGPKVPLNNIIDEVKTRIKGIDFKEAGVIARLSGAANSLFYVKNKIKYGLVLAIIIIYLLLAILYANFLYPLIIILSVPLAMAGGLMGLKFLNLFTYAPLDILTMLGFIILIGSVVNNAILIVYQALENRSSMPALKAIKAATLTRLNPIMMSMIVSVTCLLPLVIFGGDGSEIYAGLGAVIIGGLMFSTLLSLLLIPCLLSYVMKDKEE